MNPLAFFKGLTLQGWLIVGGAALLALVGTHWWAYSKGIHRERDRWEAAAAKALEKARAADSRAADKRLTDDRTNTATAKERTDAIDANPDDPYRALACQRLRAAGVASPTCEQRVNLP